MSGAAGTEEGDGGKPAEFEPDWTKCAILGCPLIPVQKGVSEVYTCKDHKHYMNTYDHNMYTDTV